MCAGHQRRGKPVVTCPQWPVCSPLTAPHCVLQVGYKLNLSAWDNFNLNIPLLVLVMVQPQIELKWMVTWAGRGREWEHCRLQPGTIQRIKHYGQVEGHKSLKEKVKHINNSRRRHLFWLLIYWFNSAVSMLIPLFIDIIVKGKDSIFPCPHCNSYRGHTRLPKVGDI